MLLGHTTRGKCVSARAARVSASALLLVINVIGWHRQEIPADWFARDLCVQYALLAVQLYFTRRDPELPYWNLITALSSPVLEDTKAYWVPTIPDMWQVAA
jgi:hypothetical protein